MKVGKFFYKYRSLTPVPLVIVLLIFLKPSLVTIIVGFFVTICGEILRFTSVGYTGLTTRSKNVQSDILVTNGPYGFIRNPIYLGNFFISLGIVISANVFFPWFIVLYIIVFAVQYFFIIRFEEKFLREKFGDRYLQYIKNVPSFFVNLKPYRKGKSVKPNFKWALRSEKVTITVVALLYIIIGVIYVWQKIHK
ncbi:isoprenylcysteine carboxylmethyltransferase family protein [candidate division WOR-3 bacterium]|nr:isoprenylcysteine carboxylmethyltransferase family protein [candidate division WOR-3 bacterium]